jgi:hypothetical protein
MDADVPLSAKKLHNLLLFAEQPRNEKERAGSLASVARVAREHLDQTFGLKAKPDDELPPKETLERLLRPPPKEPAVGPTAFQPKIDPELQGDL